MKIGYSEQKMGTIIKNFINEKMLYIREIKNLQYYSDIFHKRIGLQHIIDLFFQEDDWYMTLNQSELFTLNQFNKDKFNKVLIENLIKQRMEDYKNGK